MDVFGHAMRAIGSKASIDVEGEEQKSAERPISDHRSSILATSFLPLTARYF
jgi:hypothetical protein